MTAPDTERGGERTIKKYANRRMYDAARSRYITLDELKKMTVDGESFCVRDAKTGEDITRAALLQALLAEESFERPVLSEQSLRNLVAFFHGPFRGPMAAYFEQCLPVFLESQRRLRDKFGASLSAAEMENLAALQGAMTRRVLEQYVFGGMENFVNAQEQMRENMRKMFGGGADGMFGTPPGFPRPPDAKK
ncbi:MAG: polyhydroxyalkanoate synthesis regulator DNA-binding domain-containing protein [Gammaproteobacteria bacterium]